MKGRLTDKMRAIFLYLNENPRLIKPDGSYSIDEIWEGLLKRNVYAKTSSVSDSWSSAKQYVELYIEMKNAWAQSKNT